MAEELGKIEKPDVEKFKEGRKLFFIPLIYGGAELPEDYIIIYNRYWEQVGKQIEELEAKLGQATLLYHELIPVSGEDASKAIEDLNDSSHEIVRACLDRGVRLEALEDLDLLTEYMDWSRCLMTGLQNQKVFKTVYDSYLEVGKKRSGFIAAKLDETLGENEIGILLMRENHEVQFPPDIQVFYIAPPALDEMKRWLRERQGKPENEDKKQGAE